MTERPANPNTTVHVYFVLDRSGSMAAIRSDVIGGFNSFVEQQRSEPGRCLMTLIQFDGQDAHEVLWNARPLDQVPPLDESSFVPRASTPLFDAMGHAIADATIRREKLGGAGEPYEEVVFVTFTDGLENASREYNRTQIFDLIRKREALGWSFVYLGANQDAYEESERLGYSPGSVQNFLADARGTALAFRSTSGSISRRRRQIAQMLGYDRKNVFEGDKPADEDSRNRRG